MQPQTETTDSPVITPAKRAHWRWSWQQFLAHNARPLTVTIHSLPATFTHVYGFALPEAA